MYEIRFTNRRCIVAFLESVAHCYTAFSYPRTPNDCHSRASQRNREIIRIRALDNVVVLARNSLVSEVRRELSLGGKPRDSLATSRAGQSHSNFFLAGARSRRASRASSKRFRPCTRDVRKCSDGDCPRDLCPHKYSNFKKIINICRICARWAMNAELICATFTN